MYWTKSKFASYLILKIYFINLVYLFFIAIVEYMHNRGLTTTKLRRKVGLILTINHGVIKLNVL